MIEFEKGKLRAEYVFISKITSAYVYVVSTRDYLPYEGGVAGTHFDQPIRKVAIDKSVFDRYKKISRVCNFANPRLATLNFYGSDIISLETQPYNLDDRRYDDPETWVSDFDHSIEKIEKRIDSAVKQGSAVYMNGETIFWIQKRKSKDADGMDVEPYQSLNTDNSLRLYYARAIKLYRIGATRYVTKKDQERMAQAASAEQEQAGENGNLLDKTTDRVTFSVLEAKTIGYCPNPEAPVDQQILSFSPILEAKTVINAAGQRRSVNLEEKAIYSVGSVKSPVYANIEFVLQAARTIGKLYGNAAMDFLNIPEILSNTGVVNLTHISRSSRMNTPISRSSMDCITWILGYIYRETDLKRLRKLNTSFRFILDSGLIAHSRIQMDDAVRGEGNELPPLNTENVNRILHRVEAA